MDSSKLVFIPIRNIADNRGALSVFELPNFETKRFFWIKSRDPLLKRGGHSHKKCTQILFAIAGEIELEILDSIGSHAYTLNEFTDALVVPPGNWVEMKFKDPNSILGVLADRFYEEDDYIMRKPS